MFLFLLWILNIGRTHWAVYWFWNCQYFLNSKEQQPSSLHHPAVLPYFHEEGPLVTNMNDQHCFRKCTRPLHIRILDSVVPSRKVFPLFPLHPYLVCFSKSSKHKRCRLLVNPLFMCFPLLWVCNTSFCELWNFLYGYVLQRTFSLQPNSNSSFMSFSTSTMWQTQQHSAQAGWWWEAHGGGCWSGNKAISKTYAPKLMQFMESVTIESIDHLADKCYWRSPVS